MENNDSNLIENETLGDLKDRRKVDDLLGCLLFLSKYHKRETSAESLTFGLPIHNTSMNISMFHQASSKIGLTTRAVNRKKIKDITKLAGLYKKQLDLYKSAMEQSEELTVKECILCSIHLGAYITV